MRGELSVVRALHRNADYQYTVSEDLLPQIKAAIQARHPELDIQAGTPLTSYGRIPIMVDPFIAPNTFRVDWMPR